MTRVSTTATTAAGPPAASVWVREAPASVALSSCATIAGPSARDGVQHAVKREKHGRLQQQGQAAERAHAGIGVDAARLGPHLGQRLRVAGTPVAVPDLPQGGGGCRQSAAGAELPHHERQEGRADDKDEDGDARRPRNSRRARQSDGDEGVVGGDENEGEGELERAENGVDEGHESS
jgi:hypothetical protein